MMWRHGVCTYINQATYKCNPLSSLFLRLYGSTAVFEVLANANRQPEVHIPNTYTVYNTQYDWLSAFWRVAGLSQATVMKFACAANWLSPAYT